MALAFPANPARPLPRFSIRRGNDSWFDHEGGWLSVICLFAVLLLCVVPMARLVIAAAEAAANPAAALELLGSGTVRRAASNTLIIAVLSTVLALAIGVAVALSLAVMRVPTGRALAFLFVLSLMVAPQVSALAFKTLAGPSSPLLNTLGIAPPPGTPNPMLGLGGIVFVMGLHHAPLVAITFAAGLAGVPKSLVEAARLDGASGLQVLTRVVLPVTRVHLMAAALLAFVAGVGNFGIPALLGLPVGVITLPTLVYRELASFGQGGINDAALVSLMIAVIAGGAVVASAWLMTRKDIRIEGGNRLEPFIENPVAGRAAQIVMWAFFAVTIIAPMLSLVATALVPAYGVRLNWETLTFAQFTEVLWRQALVQRAFANSLTYAGSAALILALLALLLAYAMDRRLSRIRAWLMAIVEMPYALPGVVVAIAYILLFVRPIPLIGISIYGTGWIIVLAYLTSFLAIAIKPVMAAMTSLDREVEEAAMIDGAHILPRLAKIILPLVLPSVAAGALMVFLMAFNELTISALLWSSGTETIGVALLNLEDAGLGAEAAALAVVATVIVALIMLLLELAGKVFPDNALPWRTLSAKPPQRR